MALRREVADDDLTYRVIGIGIDVHKSLGPNLEEHLYRDALCLGLERDDLKVKREAAVPISYQGEEFGTRYLDLLVEGEVVVELKAVQQLTDAHFAQLGTNVRLANATRGLLLNFGERRLGIQRYANSAAREARSCGSAEGERRGAEN